VKSVSYIYHPHPRLTSPEEAQLKINSYKSQHENSKVNDVSKDSSMKQVWEEISYKKDSNKMAAIYI
jgi:hypothetical protein